MQCIIRNAKPFQDGCAKFGLIVIERQFDFGEAHRGVFATGLADKGAILATRLLHYSIDALQFRVASRGRAA